jgi:hypothetical protein
MIKDMKFNVLLVLLFVAVFTGCKRDLKIVFPDIQDEIEQYIQKHEYMVVIYVDSTECTPCSFNNLALWKMYRKELRTYNANILLSVRNSDEQAIIDALRTIDIACPFFIDRGNKFRIINDDIFRIARDGYFVIDKNKKVVFTGSPIVNEKRWKSFKKTITK